MHSIEQGDTRNSNTDTHLKISNAVVVTVWDVFVDFVVCLFVRFLSGSKYKIMLGKVTMSLSLGDSMHSHCQRVDVGRQVYI